MWWWRQRLQWCGHKHRLSGSPQKLRERPERTPLGPSRGTVLCEIPEHLVQRHLLPFLTTSGFLYSPSVLSQFLEHEAQRAYFFATELWHIGKRTGFKFKSPALFYCLFRYTFINSANINYYCRPDPELGPEETKMVTELLMWRSPWLVTCLDNHVFVRWYIKNNNGRLGKLWGGTAKLAMGRCNWAEEDPRSYNLRESWRVNKWSRWRGEEGILESVSKLVGVTYVAFAETHSQTVGLGLKHAKQGRMKIRVERHIWRADGSLNTCDRVWTLRTGNEKPLMVWAESGKVRFVMHGWKWGWRQAQGRSGCLMGGVSDGAMLNWAAEGRRGRVIGLKKYTGGQPSIPSWPCITNLVSLYKFVHFLSLKFLISRMGIMTFLATGCQRIKFCYLCANTRQLI